MRVMVHGNHAQHAGRLAALLGAGHEVQSAPVLPPYGSIEIDVLVSSQLTVEEARRVSARLLQVPGAGMDCIPIDSLRADCQVCNVYEHEIPIAEYVTHAVLDYCLYPVTSLFSMGAGQWARTYLQRTPHGEAYGKRAAVIGFGTIGRAVATRLRALGMHIVAVTRSGAPDDAADETRSIGDLVDVLRSADVIVLCLPLNESTRGLIGVDEFEAMKRDSLLVNVGRAQVMQEEALFNAMEQNRIGRAVLDVWYRYPEGDQDPCAPSAFPFERLDNVRATPHLAGWTHGLLERRYRFIAENVRRLAMGQPLMNLKRGLNAPSTPS